MSVKMEVLKNRNEWLKHRNRIGGSDAAAIVGLNPYMTNQELWEIKTGIRQQEDISEKTYVKYGTEAEKYLRELFKLDFPQYDVEYVENNMFLNDKYPFAHASLDGWLHEVKEIAATDATGAVINTTVIDRWGIWECKTTNILQSQQKEKWDHRIPDNYYIQVLHYLMVTEFEFVELKAQLKTEFGGVPYIQTRHYHIEKSDVEEDLKYLEEAERKFWKCVQEKKKPDLILPPL